MISLTSVELAAQQALGQEIELAAVNVADEKKGEQIVLLTTQADLTTDFVRKAMLEQGCQPLLLPAIVYTLEQLPKLGTGKTDFVIAKQIAQQKYGDQGA